MSLELQTNRQDNHQLEHSYQVSLKEVSCSESFYLFTVTKENPGFIYVIYGNDGC